MSDGSLTQIDRNVLLFLDPAGALGDHQWLFTDHSGVLRAGGDRHRVVRFARRDMFRYLLTLGRLRLQGRRVRSVLFLNDGLLCSIFPAGSGASYRAFARWHLEKPKTMRQRVLAKLPLALRAETRYLAVLGEPACGGALDPDRAYLESLDFLFFSNARGKLLLTRGETMRSGEGELVKTTTDPRYAEVMETEFVTLSDICGRPGAGGVPTAGRRFQLGGRLFFTERYLRGDSLREVLRELGRAADAAQASRVMDRLDRWFEGYLASFPAAKTPYAALNGHLLPLFRACYGGEEPALVESCAEVLARLEAACPATVAVTAHNDLWPGNFIAKGSELAVIDWERARTGRAPFFDYFWMVISSVLEFNIGQSFSGDYSRALRAFLEGSHPVCRDARSRLIRFMASQGVSEQLLPDLICVFLMEWSVQGYQALGRRTDMDDLAFGELLYFLNRHPLPSRDAEPYLSPLERG